MSAKRAALVISVLLVAYLGLTASRALSFISAGGAVPVLLGLALLIFPALGAWVIWSEWRFGRATSQLAAELAEAGKLPVDDLPRRPSGRAERVAADARFAEVAAVVSAQPDDPAGWFALAVAYDDAGDRRRARSAMRRAIALHAAGVGGRSGVTTQAAGTPTPR